MWLTLLPTLMEFGGKYRWWLIGAAGAIGVSLFAWSQLNIYIEDERVEARAAAVAECNTTQLEEEIRVLTLNLERADKRNRDLVEELGTRNEEISELESFIEEAQEELSQYETGDISDRTRVFMRLLSERSEQYHAEEDPN